MELMVYDDVEPFLEVNGGFLNAAEAENNSFLGAVAALANEESKAGEIAYLAAVREGSGSPVLNAFSAVRGNLVFSATRSGQREAAVSLIAHDLASRGIRLPGAFGEQELVGEFVRAWTALTRCTVRPLLTQTLHVLRALVPIRHAPGWLRQATGSDLDLITEWSHAFLREALGKTDQAAAQRSARTRIAAHELFLWEDGRPVCMAGRARATRHGIAINQVYTPPSARRRGYATACVAELTRQLLADGYAFCTLYADVANNESNSIYTRLGYEPIARSAVFEFGYPVA